ncbi:hypothetical protein F8M41_026096 [Gigaspora margarita]|uniref:Uncharacterized protein n=1 Tax=Gigaspora margarita TaxID=4874 RepID=A0A8H4ABB5_GIGMA|nr:hypothetical protein F8M41_026096 [Gigaspora margarita]
MAGISNNKKGNERSSPCPTTQETIIKMWILLEGHISPRKLKADLSQVSDLEDFKDVLKEIQVLKNVEPDDIVFLNHDDRNTLIPPGTLLQPLADNTTDTKPLVARYPISDSSIVVNFRFLRNTCKCRIPHSSGAWYLLRKKVKELFDSLSTVKIIFIVTKNSNGQCNLEEKIEDEYSFMNLLTRTRPNESNERILDLKIQIKGKKAFGDWTLKEVGNEIYKNNFNSIDSMQKLNLEEFPELEPSFSSEEIEYFIQQLKDKAFAFNNKISTNKATVREYISIFMTIVVKHIRKYKDSTTELHVESELDGSRGYGNLDYEVIIQDVPVLINEAKKHDMEKGVAQNLVQVYTAAEVRPEMIALIISWCFNF